jgi:tRNA (mo5U34)-methyltransferase
LAPWFHNIALNGIQTAPDHELGDYPAIKWKAFSHLIEDDLHGCTVLDIGCNAGFYSVELAKRGATVTAIDADPRYLAQAQLVATYNELGIEFQELSVYDVSSLKRRFDIVLFLGVLYHLRHPLLALDLLSRYVVEDKLIVQSMLRGSGNSSGLAADYPFWEKNVFEDPTFPCLYFVENQYAGDPTNWWIPNRACLEGMIRSAGFDILEHPEEEIYCCRKSKNPEFLYA